MWFLVYFAKIFENNFFCRILSMAVSALDQCVFNLLLSLFKVSCMAPEYVHNLFGSFITLNRFLIPFISVKYFY